MRWALQKLGVDEWLIRSVMALHTEDCTVVRTDAGLSESFEVKVGLHQVQLPHANKSGFAISATDKYKLGSRY